MTRSTLLLAAALFIAGPAGAQTLSRGTVGQMVGALEAVAAAHGPAAVADAAAIQSSAPLQEAARRLQLSPAEWESRHRAILQAYRASEAQPKRKRNVLGSTFSADNLSGLGSAALVGGGLEATAIDAATDGASAAVGEDTPAVSAMSTVGGSIAYGGGRGLGAAAGQLAVDGGAALIAQGVGGDGGNGSDRANVPAAAPAVAKSDLRAIEPYKARLRALLAAPSR